LISSNSEELRQLVRKEHLSQSEAGVIFNSVDKRLFFEQLIGQLKYKYLLTKDEIVWIMNPPSSESQLNLPLTIFENQDLSALETICKYLKEEKGCRYNEIAGMLHRDQRTIWVTYNNSLKKSNGKLAFAESQYNLPITIFQDRKLSVLESIVYYLKGNYNLRYSQIAKLIQRDERNIGAIYHKAEGKLKA
jgi:hypothetical protein